MLRPDRRSKRRTGVCGCALPDIPQLKPGALTASGGRHGRRFFRPCGAGLSIQRTLHVWESWQVVDC